MPIEEKKRGIELYIYSDGKFFEKTLKNVKV